MIKIKSMKKLNINKFARSISAYILCKIKHITNKVNKFF